MSEHATQVKHAFQEALLQVLDGIMEGGSRLKLLLCIIRNSLESNVMEGSKVKFMFECAFLEELPETLLKLSENKGNNETWYLSCFLDVVELFCSCLSLAKNDNLAHQLVACLVPLQKCLLFQDKQHKLKTNVLKTTLKLLEMMEQHSMTGKTPSECQTAMESLLAVKALSKLSPLLPVFYNVLTKLLTLNKDLKAQFTSQISSGPGQGLLESLISDLRQQQNLEAVLFLLSCSMHDAVVMRRITESFHNMSSLLGMADNGLLKERVLYFFLNVQAYAETLESIK